MQVELSTYETWCNHLSESAPYDLSATDEAISELWSGIHRENYATVWTGNESLATVRTDLRDHDIEARKKLATDEYLSYCLDTAEDLTETFTPALSRACLTSSARMPS